MADPADITSRRYPPVTGTGRHDARKYQLRLASSVRRRVPRSGPGQYLVARLASCSGSPCQIPPRFVVRQRRNHRVSRPARSSAARFRSGRVPSRPARSPAATHPRPMKTQPPVAAPILSHRRAAFAAQDPPQASKRAGRAGGEGKKLHNFSRYSFAANERRHPARARRPEHQARPLPAGRAWPRTQATGTGCSPGRRRGCPAYRSSRRRSSRRSRRWA